MEKWLLARMGMSGWLANSVDCDQTAPLGAV